MHNAHPEPLTEREIARRLLKIYETLGWELSGQQQETLKDGRAPRPEKLQGTTADRNRQP